MRQVRMIIEKENVNIHENAIDKLIEVAAGDMRRAITYLQEYSHALKCPNWTTFDFYVWTSIFEKLDIFRSKMVRCSFQHSPDIYVSFIHFLWSAFLQIGGFHFSIKVFTHFYIPLSPFIDWQGIRSCRQMSSILPQCAMTIKFLQL